MAENTDATFPPESPAAALNAAAPMDSGLNVGDIQFALELIDHACNEGLFKGWQQIERVAHQRNRYVQFLSPFVAANAEASQEAAQ